MLRLRKRIDVHEMAQAVGLDPRTLAAVERGELSAMDDLLTEWEAALIRLPDRRGWLLRLVDFFLRSRPRIIFGMALVAVVANGIGNGIVALIYLLARR